MLYICNKIIFPSLKIHLVIKKGPEKYDLTLTLKSEKNHYAFLDIYCATSFICNIYADGLTVFSINNNMSLIYVFQNTHR